MAVAQLSKKEKSVVDDLVKEAKKALNDHVKIPQQVMASGVIMNAEETPIFLDQTHEWSGSFKVDPPKCIIKGTPGVFVHMGIPVTLHHGIKAAVVYANRQPNNDDVVARGWLLAWSVPDNHGEHQSPCKVYVEAGPLGRFQKIDWSRIEKELDKSSDTSYMVDRTTGAEAGAAITGDGDTTAIGCFFGVHLLGAAN